MADGDTTMMNGKKYVNIAGRWQPADPDPVDRVEATRRPAVEANAQQGLNQVFKGAPDNPLSLDEQVLRQLDMATKPKLATDRKGYMEYIGARIATLRTKAKDIKASKSGNIQAQHT
jgi:hypothetical protein